ncbi:hypothetical protein Drorol1_Dr00000182 [Drosera rotundifolia]
MTSAIHVDDERIVDEDYQGSLQCFATVFYRASVGFDQGLKCVLQVAAARGRNGGEGRAGGERRRRRRLRRRRRDLGEGGDEKEIWAHCLTQVAADLGGMVGATWIHVGHWIGRDRRARISVFLLFNRLIEEARLTQAPTSLDVFIVRLSENEDCCLGGEAGMTQLGGGFNLGEVGCGSGREASRWRQRRRLRRRRIVEEEAFAAAADGRFEENRNKRCFDQMG